MQSLEKALHNPMPFTTGKQSINDRLTAAKHSLAGSQLGKSICKATTEEVIGPKKKHLDYLLHCTHEPNVSIPQMANMLIERTQVANWCVVFKALLTIHNLMCYGNERFSQYLASCNANFELSHFLDKSGVQGYDMSTHVRRYAKYISEKVYTYRLCAFDFCKVKRGREDGLLRTMHAEKLLKTLPILQAQVDALLEFQVTSFELSNGVINSAFILLFRDLIRLFACFNDGIINLLEKFFDMPKKQAKEALDMYKGFLLRMDKVSEFLKVAEAVGIDRGEIPDLARAPTSLLEALEAHVGVESRPSSQVTSPTSHAPTSLTQSTIQQLSSVAESTQNVIDADNAQRQKALEEERRRLDELKQQRVQEMQRGGAASYDGAAMRPPSQPFGQPTRSAVDDLLGLDAPPPAAAAPTNPFADVMSSAYSQQPHGVFAAAAAPPNAHAAAPWANGATPAFAPDFGRAFGDAAAANKPAAEALSFPSSPSLERDDFVVGPPTNPFAEVMRPPSRDSPALTNPFVSVAVDRPERPDSNPLLVATVGAHLRNPFSALQQNAQALQSVDAPTPTVPFARGDFPPAPPTPSPEPWAFEAAQAGFRSASDSPAHAMTQPIAVPAEQERLGIYDQTPFSGRDASYTASPQFPRYMMQSSDAAAMDAAGGASVPPPPGLDPLGDFFNPIASTRTSAGPPPSRQQPTTLVKGDLDSSLASLAQNLTIEKGQNSKPVQWMGGRGPVRAPAPSAWGAAPVAPAQTGFGGVPVYGQAPPPPSQPPVTQAGPFGAF